MSVTPPPGEVVAPADFGPMIPRLFNHAAWRLELLDEYDEPVTRERVARFKAGEPIDRAPREWWLAMARDVTAAGGSMGRVHVLGPLNDYLRYELACYEQNAAAGEDIRLMTRDRAAGLDLPAFDFWLFDGITAAVMYYGGGRGAFLRAEIVTDRDFAAHCRRWRDVAMSNATPLSDYQAGRTAA
jgi:uncharacterized protein DUF6879